MRFWPCDYFLNDLAASRQETSILSLEISDKVGAQTPQTIEACTQSRFRSVAEISSCSEKLSTFSAIDMVISLLLFPSVIGIHCLLKSTLPLQDKALRGLAAQEQSSSGVAVNSSETSRGPSVVGDLCPQGISFCKKTPIDLTLKTIIRFTSSSPLHW